MGHLQKLHDKYGDKGLFVYVIAVHANPKEARRLTRELRVTYPVFEGTQAELTKCYAYG